MKLFIDCQVSIIRVIFVKLLIVAFVLSTGCRSKLPQPSGNIRIDTLMIDKISIRALMIQGGHLWFGADKGRFGYIELSTGKVMQSDALRDSVKTEFRSIAASGNSVFFLNAGSPAKLIAVGRDLTYKVVYSENHPDAFYDSMKFISNKIGIAFGDPTAGCFSLLRTTDGGMNWTKLPCAPGLENLEGEAAFAASNSNIAAIGNSVWLFTGGKSSRVIKSEDAGLSWAPVSTPMVSGKSMTGTFAGDFYDAHNGMIVGGDYEDQTNKTHNKAFTTDEGLTWKTIADGSGFGYASSIKYIPGQKAKKAVTVGSSGVFFTADGGLSWERILPDPDLYTIIFANANTAYAAGRGKIIRINF